MVAAGSIGLKVRLGCIPAATARIIVSPTARDTARMNAAAMPETALGITTLYAVCSRVAPMAKLPSRSDIGTERIASSESDDT